MPRPGIKQVNPEGNQAGNKSRFGLFAGVLILLAGIAGIATAVALAPFSGGISLAGLGVGFNILMIGVSSLVAAIGLGIVATSASSSDNEKEVQVAQAAKAQSQAQVRTSGGRANDRAEYAEDAREYKRKPGEPAPSVSDATASRLKGKALGRIQD